MVDIQGLVRQREISLQFSLAGPPPRPTNSFFGVGPITDATIDEVDSRLNRFEFERWLENNYRKFDDKGCDLGPLTAAEIGRSIHRGHPSDQILLEMMREVHRYFGFPKTNKMVVGLGGGHSGFTSCAMNLINTYNPLQNVYIDTPMPETEEASGGGYFRQSWGAQIVEMMRYARNGNESHVHFAAMEGAIPSADILESLGIKLVFGVGHETTSATAYSKNEITNLLSWIDRDPAEHHAILDATSMLGSMPWSKKVASQVMSKCCLFTPLQKAIGGIPGYFLISLTPHALDLIDQNQARPSWAIPRQLKIAVPLDQTLPLSGKLSTEAGPIYDPAQDRMLGGVVNTFSALAFAETTFCLQRVKKNIGSVGELNRRSVVNRQTVSDWISSNELFELAVTDPERRGAAVTLLKIRDPDVSDPTIRARILAMSKQLLSFEGLTHPNGEHEKGLNVARYVNAFPGTPSDYRAWIGGIRSKEDVIALLENIKYAYLRAKVVVLEEELEKRGVSFPPAFKSETPERKDDPDRAYKVLICDLVGLRFDRFGDFDCIEVRRHIERSGGIFHEGFGCDEMILEKGRIHFFYLPDLSTESELLKYTDKGQFDAVISAATIIPGASIFRLGGVRIGAGTGNMNSNSWGAGSGVGGEAPLMNTPSFNSRATAQMVFKALLRVIPDLPVEELHRRVVDREFDTGRHLRDFPTEKLEGKKFAILGYGNIGREVARIASAFGMRVTIYAKSHHKEWIESQGFAYAGTPEDAAVGADVLSLHIGLGDLSTVTRTYANVGLVGAAILGAMSDGAVLINYDRGEIVDVAALKEALASGKIRHAAIDADIFVDPARATLSGPLAPYVEVEKCHKGRLELLPHAAADTEHFSRVEGAKQAVDQIIDCIRFKVVSNLKGNLPAGYTDSGSFTVAQVGKVTDKQILQIATDSSVLRQARDATETMAAVWNALACARDPDRIRELVARYGARLVLNYNYYATLMRKLGLDGPYE